MNRRIALFGYCTLLLLPLTAQAYVGPGAGLSLLGALWALILALLTAVFFIFAWPIRRMLRRRREALAMQADADNIDIDATAEAHVVPVAREAEQPGTKR